MRKKKLRDLRRDYDAARAETVMQTGGSDRGIMSQTRPSVLIDPTIITHVLRETADHYLITNRGD